MDKKLNILKESSLDVSEKGDFFISIGHIKSIYALAISFDRQYIVSGSKDEAIKLWDINF